MTALLEGQSVSSVAREYGKHPEGDRPQLEAARGRASGNARARSLFAYMVLLNVIRSFWARVGSPENSRPVRGALRNSL